jgi:hypothetical protein
MGRECVWEKGREYVSRGHRNCYVDMIKAPTTKIIITRIKTTPKFI